MSDLVNFFTRAYESTTVWIKYNNKNSVLRSIDCENQLDTFVFQLSCEKHLYSNLNCDCSVNCEVCWTEFSEWTVWFRLIVCLVISCSTRDKLHCISTRLCAAPSLQLTNHIHHGSKAQHPFNSQGHIIRRLIFRSWWRNWINWLNVVRSTNPVTSTDDVASGTTRRSKGHETKSKSKTTSKLNRVQTVLELNQALLLKTKLLEQETKLLKEIYDAHGKSSSLMAEEDVTDCESKLRQISNYSPIKLEHD